MVKGLDTFRKYFADYESQYVLIGDATCDILFESNEVNFRATSIITRATTFNIACFSKFFLPTRQRLVTDTKI